MKNVCVVFFVGFACFVVGFFIGRGKQIVRTEVRYEQGDTQVGHYGVSDLVPKRSELPSKVDLPTVPAVMWMDSEPVVVQRVDTIKIVRDYSAVYHYSKLLFDNTDGKLTVEAGTQYNRLAYLNYEFVPVREVHTEVKERKWMPFVSVGYSTNNYLSIGGGTFYYNIGVEYNYSRSLKLGDSYHSIFLKYKF